MQILDIKMAKEKQNIYRDKSGYTYNRDEYTIYDPEGNVHGSVNRVMSDKMAKLWFQAEDAYRNGDEKQYKKFREKMELLEVAESPYLISTPLYCYTFIFYKLRKVAGFTQEEMADALYIPRSTYIKIENRILTPSLSNIITLQVIFDIKNIEIAELYNSIYSYVYNFGHLHNFLQDENPHTKKYEYNISTPIDLYESKMTKDEYNVIDAKFHEIVSKGKQRSLERNKRMAEKDKQPKEFEELSFEEQQYEIDQADYRDSEAKHEHRQKRIEELKKFHGDKYFYS